MKMMSCVRCRSCGEIVIKPKGRSSTSEPENMGIAPVRMKPQEHVPSHFFHETTTTFTKVARLPKLCVVDCIDMRNFDTAYRMIDCNYCYGWTKPVVAKGLCSRRNEIVGKRSKVYVRRCRICWWWEKTQEEQDHQEEVIVTVEDTGSGIDPEIFPRLFTKFSSKSFSGTGLGLYISKSIIEALGGNIWAQNNNEQGKHGATFSFSLPLY